MKKAISIHALLAESDQATNSLADTPPQISIHALLAESDGCVRYCIHARVISIHALLAESDAHDNLIRLQQAVFLSTLSLRRATWLYLLLCR